MAPHMATKYLLRDLYIVGGSDRFREDAPVASRICKRCHQRLSFFLIHLGE
jgi:hypothetical protein